MAGLASLWSLSWQLTLFQQRPCFCQAFHAFQFRVSSTALLTVTNSVCLCGVACVRVCVCVWWVGGCARNVEDGPPIKVCTAMLFTYQHCQDVDHCFTCAQHNALLPCSPPAMTSQQTLTYNLKSSGACGLCGGTSQCGRIITRRAKDGMRRTTMDPQEE